MFVPPLKDIYKYPTLIRMDGEQRLYQTDSGNLPSVTTILSATASEEKKAALAGWRTYVGDTKADEIVKEACDIGTLMHENLENRLMLKPDHPGNMPMRTLARNMADCIQNSAWPNINEVWGQEVQLYYRGLWAGTSDLVGVHKGRPSIMDYKNSRSPKKKEDIDSYFQQGAAYALAHNQMFGTDINTVVIFMCVRKDPKNLVYLEYEVTGSEFDFYRDQWIEAVSKFYQK